MTGGEASVCFDSLQGVEFFMDAHGGLTPSTQRLHSGVQRSLVLLMYTMWPSFHIWYSVTVLLHVGFSLSFTLSPSTGD